MSRTSRYLSGWTLLEIIFVISLISILITTAIPAWYKHFSKKKLYTTQQAIRNAVNYARGIALNGNRTVIICSNNHNWSEGFKIAYFKPSQSCEQLSSLREWNFKHSDVVSVLWHGFDKKQHLIFTPSPNQWTTNGKFIVSISGHQPEILVLNRLGQIVTKRS